MLFTATFGGEYGHSTAILNRGSSATFGGNPAFPLYLNAAVLQTVLHLVQNTLSCSTGWTVLFDCQHWSKFCYNLLTMVTSQVIQMSDKAQLWINEIRVKTQRKLTPAFETPTTTCRIRTRRVCVKAEWKSLVINFNFQVPGDNKSHVSQGRSWFYNAGRRFFCFLLKIMNTRSYFHFLLWTTPPPPKLSSVLRVGSITVVVLSSYLGNILEQYRLWQRWVFVLFCYCWKRRVILF